MHDIRSDRWPAAQPLTLAALWRILRRTALAFLQHNVMAVAGGIAFFVLLAFVPAIAAFVSLYGLFADVPTALRHLQTLGDLLPPATFDLLAEQAARLAAQTSGELSAAFGISLAVSLWSANAGTKALMEGLNLVKETTETRSFLRLNLVSFAFTMSGLVLLCVAIAGVIVMPAIFAIFGDRRLGETLILMARWPVLAAILVVGIGLVYRYGPAPPRATAPRIVTSGSVVAAMLWIAASGLFSWYVSSFGDYSRVYGPLSAIVIFMTWIWISTMAVLIGAELDAEIIRERDLAASAAHRPR